AQGWTDPNFFPIAVWLQTAHKAQDLKSLGINTMVGMWHDGADLSSIGASTGMFFIAQDEWSTAEIADNPKVVGWLASDECDMGYSGCNDTPVPVQQGYVDAIRARND